MAFEHSERLAYFGPLVSRSESKSLGVDHIIVRSINPLSEA
jgi:hypothetical protein